MAIDLSRLHAAFAAHTTETQKLLNSNQAHAAAAAAAQASVATQVAAAEAAAEATINTLTTEIESQTAQLAAFNIANPAA